MAFLDSWGNASLVTLGFFWTALWAFVLGYTISSMIQVFITRQKMRETMGEGQGAKAVGIGTFFGFISSSCSFAALSTTRALFGKGAGLVPSLAFLLASTNLVIELGIVIAVFLAWQFVVAEYVGGILLILLMWVVVRFTRPKRLVEQARERVEADAGGTEDTDASMAERVQSQRHWNKVARRYVGEWGMVWKDVTIGFTVAGIIAVFVPTAFFEFLFPGTGESEPAFWQVLVQALVGPVAAFFTFIGSMGNIPLAAVLFGSGVSMAGVVAFIFSDLVVFPVLRIQAQYYGWKLALYIAGVFFVVLVVAAVLVHYGFVALDLLPDAPQGDGQPEPTDRFSIDHTLFLNLAAVVGSLVMGWVWWRDRPEAHWPDDWVDRTLVVLAVASYGWLLGGLGVWTWQALAS